MFEPIGSRARNESKDCSQREVERKRGWGKGSKGDVRSVFYFYFLAG